MTGAIAAGKQHFAQLRLCTIYWRGHVRNVIKITAYNISRTVENERIGKKRFEFFLRNENHILNSLCIFNAADNGFIFLFYLLLLLADDLIFTFQHAVSFLDRKSTRLNS